MNGSIPPPPNHQCGAACSVEALFGNAYRCLSSGMVHICDRNCDQRVAYDRWSSICVISKKLGPPMTGSGGIGGAADLDTAARKRMSGGGGQEAEQQQLATAAISMMERQGSKRGRVSGADDTTFAPA
jgi:hypothetical protein